MPGDCPSAGSTQTPGPRHSTQITAALIAGSARGVAFLWFVGVLRDRLGGLEDRFFATVFLGAAGCCF